MEGDWVGAFGDGNVGDPAILEVIDYAVFGGAAGRHEVVGTDCCVDRVEHIGGSLFPASAIENDGDFGSTRGRGPCLAGLHVVAVDHNEIGSGEGGFVDVRGGYCDTGSVCGDDVAFAAIVDGDGREDRQFGEVGIEVDEVDGVLAGFRFDSGSDSVVSDGGDERCHAAEMGTGDGCVGCGTADKDTLTEGGYF